MFFLENPLGCNGILGLREIYRNVPDADITTLNLSNTLIGSQGMLLLNESIPILCHIEKIILNKCMIRDEGMFSLYTAIQSGRLSKLKELYLAGNDISYIGLIHLGSAILSKQLVKLEFLDLSDNEINEIAMKKMYEALQSFACPSLKTIIIGGNKIDAYNVVTDSIHQIIPACRIIW